MDAAIDMYYFPASPPSRAVLLLARALGIVLNIKLVDIMAGQQLQPDFLKMNPTHTVPTMDDNGYILWESRAIMEYLVDKYDKQGKFAVSDPKIKGLVNNMLYFDATTLFERLGSYFRPVFQGVEAPNQAKAAKFQDALHALNIMLENKQWAAGDKMTIADISLVTTISTAEAVGFDISKHDHIKAWFEKTKKALAPSGYEEIDQKGANFLKEGFKAATS